MQDATFITSKPNPHAKEPCGPEAKTRRNKEGTWAKKKTGNPIKAATTHQNQYRTRSDKNNGNHTHKYSQQPNKPQEPEEIAYKYRGYLKAPHEGYNTTINQDVREHKITIKQKKITQQKESHIKKSPLETPIHMTKKNIFPPQPPTNHHPPNPHQKTSSPIPTTT